MEPIEQIFLHVRCKDDSRTPEITAESGGVRCCDRSAILSWFSVGRRESLLRYDVFNLFFYPLPSGCFALGIIYPFETTCVSYVLTSKSFLVRLLILPAKTLLRKGNNPIALFNELNAAGKIPFLHKTPNRLRPIVADDKPRFFESYTLASLSARLGPVLPAALCQSCIDEICSFFSPGRLSPALSTINALFNLLPISFRTELTFSTELFLSTDNLFRLVALSEGRERNVRLSKDSGVPLVDLESRRERNISVANLIRDPWPQFVFQLLQSGDYECFAQILARDYEQALDADEPIDFVDWDCLQQTANTWIKALANRDDAIFSSDNRRKDTTSSEALRCVSTVERIIPLLRREGEQSDFRTKSYDNDCHDDDAITEGLSPIVVEVAKGKPFLKILLTELDANLRRLLMGDDSVKDIMQEQWTVLLALLNWEEQDRLRENYLGRISAKLLLRTDEDENTQFGRSADLLELMVLFMEGPTKTPNASSA